MAFTINDNPDKYDLWIYDGTGLNPISPNPNNIFIKNGVKNIFCMPARERITANVPNGTNGSEPSPQTVPYPVQRICNDNDYTSSGWKAPPFLTAISPDYAVGVWHYPLHGGGSPFPIKFWYRHANSGSGGFITRDVSNILLFDDRDTWRFCRYQSGSNFDNNNSDLLLYKFSEPLPADADFAILPIFNDKKLWMKNIFNKVPGVHLDQDSRLIPGYVSINGPYILDGIVYCQTDDINSHKIIGASCKSGINITSISASFISNIYSLTDNDARSNYLDFLQESGNYYDKIFRSINAIVGDSSRPFFEICLHSNSLILYGCATGGHNEGINFDISDSNYVCSFSGVVGDLISTSMFGLNYNENESNPQDLILGRDLMGSNLEEQNEAISKIPVKEMDDRYTHPFTLISDTVSLNSLSAYDNNAKYLHGFDFCFYVDKDSFDPQNMGSSPFYPNGSSIPTDKRNTLNLTGTYNYLASKYAYDANNPSYLEGLWEDSEIRNIVFLGLENIDYGGDYGSFTLFSDFKAPLSATDFSLFETMLLDPLFIHAKNQIVSYAQLHIFLKDLFGKSREICWLDLIGSNGYKPPYIGGDIDNGYWDVVTEEQKNMIFDAWDKVYDGLIELFPIISFNTLDSVNTEYSGESTWQNLSDLRIKISVEYIKRYCYLKNIKCPKIIPFCDTTAGFNDYDSCGESDPGSQRLRPLSDEQFLNNQIIPILSSGVDGLFVRNTDIFDLVHSGYPGEASVSIDIDAQKKFALNYICNHDSKIELYDCDYYDNYSSTDICEDGYYIYPTEPPGHGDPDYAEIRLYAFNKIEAYICNKLKLINHICVKYKTYKYNSNGTKNDLIFNNGFIPWGSDLLEHKSKFSTLKDIYELFDNKNIYTNNLTDISTQHFLYDSIFTAGIDWDASSSDIPVYDIDNSYTTGSVIRYFSQSDYKWVVFKCINFASIGEYPGKTNYFIGTGNNKKYLFSNIGHKWETRDIQFLYNNVFKIKSPNNVISDISNLISYQNNNRYSILSHTSPWIIPEDTMREAMVYLMHDQGELISKYGHENYNNIGNFAITSGESNNGLANEYIESETIDPYNVSDSMISKFIGLENSISLLENNKGVISDFIYWHRNIASIDAKKIDTDTRISDIFISNNFYTDSGDTTINSINISPYITRYQLFNYTQSVISNIKRNITNVSPYICNFGSIGSINGAVGLDEMPSVDYSRSDIDILDILKQVTENYSHVNTFSANNMNSDISTELIDGVSYITNCSYPQSWSNRLFGMIDKNFKDSQMVDIFSDSVLNERLYEIGWRLNSDMSCVIRFTVISRMNNYLLLSSNSDNSSVFNELKISHISLEITELNQDGSEFWLCHLFIGFTDDGLEFTNRSFLKVFVNNINGILSEEESVVTCSWKINKFGIDYSENNLINSFNPSVLFSIIEKDSFDSFSVGSDINMTISFWNDDKKMINNSSSYKYSAKALSRLQVLPGDNSYFTTASINERSAKQFGSNNSKIIGGINIIENNLDLFNYEKFSRYLNIYGISNSETISIDASCSFLPLWVSKYGLEEPVFRCNRRYQYKNNDHMSSQSFDYNGFVTHESYGLLLEDSQTAYESYSDFVKSYLKIARILKPNVKIIPSLSLLNKHDNDLLSCFYHPKELCYYIVRPWLISNYSADSIYIYDDLSSLIDGCFLPLYPSVIDNSSSFRFGLELGLFNGKILDTESAWTLDGALEFDWDSIDRGGMLWNSYGEQAMSNLSYTSLNGNDSSFGKQKIIIFIKQVLDFYIRDICQEMKILMNNPLGYLAPSNTEIGYDKVSFINGIILTSINELKIEIVGGGVYAEENWQSYDVEWYKSKNYVDDPLGFILFSKHSGSGFKQFIYAPNELIQDLHNGDRIKIKLFVNNKNGINYGFSNYSEVYFEANIYNNRIYFVPSTTLNTRSKNVIQIIDPVIMGASTYINPIDLPPALSALDYEVWSASWKKPPSFAKAIVSFIRIAGSEDNPFFGGPATASASDNTVSDQLYNIFKENINTTPKGRRVLLPSFWFQNPINKNYSPLEKIQHYIGLDGTSFSDTAMIWSLWQDNCILDAKSSFSNFILRCKDDDISFDYISDYSSFSQGDTPNLLNLRIKPGRAPGEGNRHYTGEEWSNPNALESIITDDRFGSYINTITNMNAESDFMERYTRSVRQFYDTDRAIYPTYDEGWYVNAEANAITALTPIFGYSANLSKNSSNLSATIAWDSMVKDLGNIHYRTMLFKEVLDDNGFSDVTISVFGQYNLSAAESKYVQDHTGAISSPNSFSSSWIDNSPHLYGITDQETIHNGYIKNPISDDQKYMFVKLNPIDSVPLDIIKLSSYPLWVAFLNDIIVMRCIIRSSSSSWQSFSPWVIDPGYVLSNSRYNTEQYGSMYWKELIFHICLHGSSRINYFNEVNSNKIMNDALNEWRNISNNSRAQPCSNNSGDIDSEIDRIHIKDASENLLISGGRLLNSNKYVWRITAPPSKIKNKGVSFVRVGTDSDLPETIIITDGCGTWITRETSSPPIYKTYDDSPSAPISSLDYEVFANFFSGEKMFDDAPEAIRWGSPTYPFLSIVPAIPISGNTYNGHREPSDISLQHVTDEIFNKFKDHIMSIPNTRRVVNASYWWQDIVVYSKNHFDYYKVTADGTLYDGDRFQTPWCDVNTADAKTSIIAFLNKCNNNGVNFNYYQDDKENQHNFHIFGHNSLNSWGSVDSNGLPLDPNPDDIHKSHMPDARFISAIVSDIRFTTLENPVSGMTLKDEFIDNYKKLSGLPDSTSTWEELLSPFINITSITGYVSAGDIWLPYGCEENGSCGPMGRNIVSDGYDKFHYVIPAWQGAIDNLLFNYYLNKMQYESLQEVAGFETVKVLNYESTPMSTEESYFYQGSNMDRFLSRTVANSFSGHSFYGLSHNMVFQSWALPNVDFDIFTENFACRSGYIKIPTNDEEKYNWSGYLTTDYMGPAGPSSIVRYPEESNVYFTNHKINALALYIFNEEFAFKTLINDVKRQRSSLRSDAVFWESFTPYISGPNFLGAVYGYNINTSKYWYELIYHLCLGGARFFCYFDITYSASQAGHVNDALNEWRNISNNSRARPCSNSTGDINLPVDRILLWDVFENVLVSGGLLLSSNKYLWRITVAPKRFFANNTCVLQRVGNDSDIPEFITINGDGDIKNSRGAWITRQVSTPPVYSHFEP